MPTYIGENKIIDRYLGDKFLEAAYIGDQKVYDPYTEITGHLPMIYKSRATVALKNYRIYGTSEGAGVETENLINSNEDEQGSGYVANAVLSQSNGVVSELAVTWAWISEYIPIEANQTYCYFTELYRGTNNQWANNALIVLYDENKNIVQVVYKTGHLESVTYEAANVDIFTASSNAKYLRVAIDRGSTMNMLVKDSTPSSTYIPHGYKLPLTVESGAQSQDIPIYIGSSKLGEEEYVDYESGKIYRDIDGTLTPTDPPVPLPPIPTYKGENTLSSTETLGEVTVKGRIRPIVYGWHVDPSISDPAQAVTYLADAVGKTPAAMGASSFSYGDWTDAFFMPKPCMLRSDGTVAYYLDPDDYTKKADGTASDVANASFDGNAMMEWPLIWHKFEAGAADGEGYFYCSDKQVDESYKCWCNYDCNDNIIDHFYTAIYNGTGTDKMRSLSGIQLTPANGNGSTTGQQEVTGATANNTTSDVEWYTDVYSDRQLISALLILMSKCLDDQAVYGRGLDTGSQTAAESYVTGTLNDKGLFYGVTADGNSAVKVFGMENWFGCKWRRTAGLIGGANDTYLYKLTYGMADGSTVKGYNSNGQGYLTANGVSRPANNYVTKMGVGKHGLLPKETAAVSSSLYYGVYYYNGSGYSLFGGASSSGRTVGSLCVGLHHGFSASPWGIGASLSCKPIKVS